jgi:hypothetical protein
MPAMYIDKQNGTVNLPNGVSIASDLSQDAFRATPAFTAARSEDCGTLPWIYYHLPGGEIDGKPLLVSLCFYDQMLVDVSLTADLYPPGPKDWSSYSLEMEAATKQFHDRLLETMFGTPMSGGSVVLDRVPEGKAALDRPLCWTFPWGQVCSYHDPRSGGTSITISYGNRMEEARQAFRFRRPIWHAKQ